MKVLFRERIFFLASGNIYRYDTGLFFYRAYRNDNDDFNL